MDSSDNITFQQRLHGFGFVTTLSFSPIKIQFLKLETVLTQNSKRLQLEFLQLYPKIIYNARLHLHVSWKCSRNEPWKPGRSFADDISDLLLKRLSWPNGCQVTAQRDLWPLLPVGSDFCTFWWV